MFNVVFFGSNGKALASKIDVSSLQVGDGLYYGSTQLSSKTFANEFANIVSGRYMFSTSNIKTFPGSLASLQDGTRMFEATSSLTSFTSEMPNLSNGTYMFYNTPLLASFSSSLPNLRIGECMFQNAKVLPSFSVSLPKLTNGSRMFDGCASLETFNGVLPSLENGSYIFQGCKLSGHSVRNIVKSLPTHETEHAITIGINCTENIEGQREFLRETGYNTFEEIEDALAAKGWKVVWHFQGFPSGWRPVEYLEGTGTNAQHYIDTGIIGDETTSVRLLAAAIDNGLTFQCIFGARTRFKDNELTIWPHTVFSDGSPETCGVIRSDEIVKTYSSEKKCLYEINPDKGIIGEYSGTWTNNKPFQTPGNLFLFLFYQDTPIFANAATAKIYSLIIAKNDEEVLNFIPCIDNLGNPCFYDRISGVSFYNKGNGKFLIPTTSVTYTLRQPVAEFAQLTDSGVRKLYHLPYDYEGTLEEFVEENGFKQLVENERPEEGNWIPEWMETEDTVVLNWVEAPEEIIEV